MTEISAGVMEVLRQAAELRANGGSWEAVAEELGEQVDVCRRWPVEFEAVWRDLLHEADRQVLRESAAEARVVLRKMLRAEDDKLRFGAAKQLLSEKPPRVSAKAVAASQEDRELAAFIAQVKELPDEELQQLLREELADWGAGFAVCQPASAARPE